MNKQSKNKKKQKECFFIDKEPVKNQTTNDTAFLMIKSSQADKNKKQTHCSLCKITLTSHNYQMHLVGKKHMKRLKTNEINKEKTTKMPRSDSKIKKTKQKRFHNPQRNSHCDYFHYDSDRTFTNPYHYGQPNPYFSFEENGFVPLNDFMQNHNVLNQNFVHHQPYDLSFRPRQMNDRNKEVHSNTQSANSYTTPVQNNVEDTSLKWQQNQILKTPECNQSCDTLNILGNFNESNQNTANMQICNSSLQTNFGNPCEVQSVSKSNGSNHSKSLFESEAKNAVKRRNSIPNTSRCKPDSCGTPDHTDSDKTKQQKTTLSENVADRIARLVNPSNQKDKAAVENLINQFTKSKKKQCLTRLKIPLESTEKSNELSDTLPETLTESVQHLDLFGKENGKSMYVGLQHDFLENPSLISPDLEIHSERNDCSPGLFALNQKLSNAAPKKADKTVISSGKTSSTESSFRKSDKETEPKRKCFNHKKNANGKNKKQRCSGVNCFDQVINETVSISSVDNSVLSPVHNSLAFTSTSLQSSPLSSSTVKDLTPSEPGLEKFTVTVKQEPKDMLVKNCREGADHQVPLITSLLNTISPVESIMDLFASGNFKVKQEFDDPLIDAIKSVDPNELVKACENDSCMTQMSNLITKNFQNQSYIVDNVKKSSNKNSSSSIAVESSIKNELSLSNSPSETLPISNPDLHQISSKNLEHDLKETSKNVKNVSLCNDKPSVPPLEYLVQELKTLSSLETIVKENLQQAEVKIHEYLAILEEWKNKKIKYLSEEEELRIKRNNVIHLMQEILGKTSKVSDSNSDVSNSTSCTFVESTSKSIPDSELSQASDNATKECCSADPQVSRTSVAENINKQSDTPKPCQSPEKSYDSAEICILPYDKNANIPVIDLEVSSPEKHDDVTSGFEKLTNISKNGKNIFDAKSVTVHKTIVNFMQVHEGYLYTCSNDSTAKRFNLEDVSQTVTYQHVTKNVLQLSVENVKGKPVVVTSCSDCNLSVFTAEEGKRVRTFFHSSRINYICKGWSMFYAAYADGSVTCLTLKEERNIVKPGCEPSVCIATAYQGRVRVLVTLSTYGEILIRNAESGLLIRCLKEILKLPSHMSVFNDFAYFSSSDRSLSMLNISTGRVEKKLQLSAPITGLAVNEDYIFTTTFRGVVQCYAKNNERSIKYFSAGNSLTCIHVYQNWVFTGNRQGEVAVLKCDVTFSHGCQINNCKSLFMHAQDLKAHINKDHLLNKKSERCPWNGCNRILPLDWNEEKRKKHIYNRHIF